MGTSYAPALIQMIMSHGVNYIYLNFFSRMFHDLKLLENVYIFKVKFSPKRPDINCLSSTICCT